MTLWVELGMEVEVEVKGKGEVEVEVEVGDFWRLVTVRSIPRQVAGILTSAVAEDPAS